MLQNAGVLAVRARWRHLSCRTFRTTAFCLEDAAVATKSSEEEAAIKLRNKKAARDYNNARAAYRRQVNRLRLEYAEELARQRAADKAEQDATLKATTRRRLERQRRKNIRSAKNAMRQKQLREEREKEFNEHLRVMQLRRDARNERYAAARQLVIDELEEVAHLWITTPEEVEAAFTPEAEQLLWAFPGGILGEPNPTLDTHFWQNETHTWHVDSIYKARRQVLLEEVNEESYNEANIDKNFWTEERLEERKRLEEKARLRAMVQSAGRSQLLRMQAELRKEKEIIVDGEVPHPASAPSNKVLRNQRAQERRGARLLLNDPTKFFVFDNTGTDQTGEIQTSADGEQTSYFGPSLGAPIRLRDPLREHTPQNRVFPVVIGKSPKPDMRTEREKKQQAREKKMLAAARAEQAANMDIELAAEQKTADDLTPDIDYNNFDWDSDKEEWKKGLDPEADAEIIHTPLETSYPEADIKWVVEKLEGQVGYLEDQMKGAISDLKKEVNAGFTASDERDPDDLGAALLSLPEKELVLLADLDETYADMSPEEFLEAIKAINLTEDQIRFILERDRSNK